jgi:hypothetical protein
MLKKIGRWTAARLQGSKGKAKYDDWMKRNPLVGTALDVAGYGGAAMLAPGLLAKTPLKGLLTASTSAGAPVAQAAGTAADIASAVPMPSSIASTVGGKVTGRGIAREAGRTALRGARAAGGFVKDNPLASAMALEGLLTGSQNAQQMRLERQRMRDERERQQFLSQLLAPTFMQYYQGE